MSYWYSCILIDYAGVPIMLDCYGSSSYVLDLWLTWIGKKYKFIKKGSITKTTFPLLDSEKIPVVGGEWISFYSAVKLEWIESFNRWLKLRMLKGALEL